MGFSFNQTFGINKVSKELKNAGQFIFGKEGKSKPVISDPVVPEAERTAIANDIRSGANQTINPLAPPPTFDPLAPAQQFQPIGPAQQFADFQLPGTQSFSPFNPGQPMDPFSPGARPTFDQFNLQSPFFAQLLQAINSPYNPTAAENDLMSAVGDKASAGFAARGLGQGPIAATSTAASIAPYLIEARQRAIENLLSGTQADIQRGGLNLQARGQDIGAGVDLRGQDINSLIQGRGQDINRLNEIGSQGLQARGQDINYAGVNRGQDINALLQSRGQNIDYAGLTRGQDIQGQQNLMDYTGQARGQDLTGRGQDIQAATDFRNQDLGARGQDINAIYQRLNSLLQLLQGTGRQNLGSTSNTGTGSGQGGFIKPIELSPSDVGKAIGG